MYIRLYQNIFWMNIITSYVSESTTVIISCDKCTL